MKSRLIYGLGQRRVSLACGAIATALQVFEANATTSFSQLPDMTELTQFATFGADWRLNNSTVNGPVGISSGGTIAIPNPSTVNGNLYLDVGANQTKGGTVSGTTFTGSSTYGNIKLTAEQNQALSASSAFAGFAPDFSSAGNIKGNRTFGVVDGVADVYVIDINGNLSLKNNQAINFVGDPGDVFVLNISGKLSMKGHARIGTLDQAATTLINVRGAGNLGTIAGIHDAINGTLLLPNARSAALHGVSGAIYSGDGRITLLSHGVVDFVPFIPEAGTYLAGALMLLPLGASALRLLRKSR